MNATVGSVKYISQKLGSKKVRLLMLTNFLVINNNHYGFIATLQLINAYYLLHK